MVPVSDQKGHFVTPLSIYVEPFFLEHPKHMTFKDSWIVMTQGNKGARENKYTPERLSLQT